MARVVIIGGSGHVGTYLVPRLVAAGYEVVNVSRGQREPYSRMRPGTSVETVALDRDAEEKAGTFGQEIRELKPDIVIDMICFTLHSAEHLVEALRGSVQHFLHCGTIWVHGPSVAVPTTEVQPRRPFGEYGIQKAAIEAYLLDEARRDGFPATSCIPAISSGRAGRRSTRPGTSIRRSFTTLARGEELALPNFGLETVHHVHADDVAQVFMRAIANWSAAVGEAFHAVSPAAVTLRGYAEAMAALVRAGAEADFPAVAGMEGAADRGGRDRDLGAHRPQPELQHRQGASACSATGRATPRSRRSTRRSPG